jgi:hypothetical protein
MSTAAAIDAFWVWWAGASTGFTAAFDGGDTPDDAMIRAMSDHVAAIDEGLDWEFGKGRKSRHHLCLSAKGDPVLRVVAERWRKRAPPADAAWEFYSARQQARGASGDLSLQIAGVTVSLGALTFAVEENDASERVDVRGHHPAFASIDDDELRIQILFIGLDNLLGEDGVERWIGGVEESREPVPGAISWHDLGERVEALAARATGDKWAVLRGDIDGRPVFVMLNQAIKRVDHLLLDMHVAVVLPLRSPTATGLTTHEEAGELNAMEDELVASLGEHAVHIGRETTGGRRTIHLHVGEGGPARGLLDRWAARYPGYDVAIEVAMDPRWDILRRWT